MALFLLITSFKKVLLLTITIALFASLSSKLVVGVLVDTTANATTSTTPLSSCVTNNAQLRNAVKLAQTDPTKKRTKITLCATPIQISNAIDPVTGSTGINLSNRYIDLDCKLASAIDTTCILEGKYKTRLFFGSNVNLTVHNVGFADASPAYTDTMNGGALSFWNNSVVTLNAPISFTNNYSPMNGGAISMTDSTLTINGAPDSEDIYVSYNHADKYGGAIALYNSKFVTTNKVMIARNSAAYSGAIELYNTSATIRDVRFDTNSATPGVSILSLLYFANNRSGIELLYLVSHVYLFTHFTHNLPLLSLFCLSFLFSCRYRAMEL